MATRTIRTCDVCGDEIKTDARSIVFSATRWKTGRTPNPIPDGYSAADDVAAEFGISEFCSDTCVIGAVRALLNGHV